jgi:K+-transporting ATPase ATPase C chain
MGNDFSTSLRPALVMTLLFALLLGIAYPLALTGIGQVIFPSQANGSLVMDNGRAVGSTLIGQNFTSDRYFWPRPSAAGKGYDGLASSGSNFAPTSKALVTRLKADEAKLHATNPGAAVPADLLTASGSGLDPNITPGAAAFQIARVATARGMAEQDLRSLVAASTEQPLFGILGEPRVNVLELNRRLDAKSANKQP